MRAIAATILAVFLFVAYAAGGASAPAFDTGDGEPLIVIAADGYDIEPVAFDADTVGDSAFCQQGECLFLVPMAGVAMAQLAPAIHSARAPPLDQRAVRALYRPPIS